MREKDWNRFAVSFLKRMLLKLSVPMVVFDFGFAANPCLFIGVSGAFAANRGLRSPLFNQLFNNNPLFYSGLFENECTQHRLAVLPSCYSFMCAAQKLLPIQGIGYGLLNEKETEF
jgi:hypothetical protein